MSIRSLTEKLQREREAEYVDVLRDRLAAKAMVALIRRGELKTYQSIARAAYRIAGSMLEERKK